jgi:predicted CoA-binding protein
MERDSHTDDQIRQILSLKKVAVVGMSQHPGKAAHGVPRYLSENGYNITPVNPRKWL